MKHFLMVAGVAFFAASSGSVCAQAVSAFVSIAPQAFFVEQVGGDRVAVEVLVPAGQSPATYSVSPTQAAKLSEADVYFRIGVPFEEALVPRIRGMAASLRIVDTREGIALRRMEAHGHHHAGHGHEQAGRDPHIWLSPKLVMLQAVTVCEALCDIDPDGRESYRRNLVAFLDDLAALHLRLRRQLKPFRGKTILVFHPAWGYFTEAYGLVQKAIEVEGKSPSARQLATIIEEARRAGARAIFVQRQFDKSSAEAVARSIGAGVVQIDPLARDYVENMGAIAEQVEKVLRGQR